MVSARADPTASPRRRASPSTRTTRTVTEPPFGPYRVRRRIARTPWPDWEDDRGSARVAVPGPQQVGSEQSGLVGLDGSGFARIGSPPVCRMKIGFETG